MVFFSAGLVLGLRSLQDNSFLTHLATGRLILERGSVPTSDPYSWSAEGAPWVVQSWLASTLYATAEAVGGLNAIRVMSGLLSGLLALLAWRLLRPATSLIVRLALGAAFLLASAPSWAERPFMIGLVALGAVTLTIEEERDPRWLIPICWIWVNSHGSYFLGLGYLLLTWIGRKLDGQSTGHARRTTGWFMGGILLGAVGPLGIRSLTFPVALLSRREVLSGVVEWRAPTYEELGDQAFLALLVLALLLLVRRPTYRHALVVAVFGAAAISSARNISVFTIVVLPSMAAATGHLGSLRSRDRVPVFAGAAATTVAAALLVVVSASRLDGPDLRLAAYPVRSLALVTETDGDIGHLVTEDFVGNLQTYIYGDGATVFYDDRFDMYPVALTADYRAIAAAGPRVGSVLDRLRVHLILWERADALVSVLLRDPEWRALAIEDRWVLLCRREALDESRHC